MSACILIQPHNLMHELLQMSDNDGIMDIILIISAQFVLKTAELKEGSRLIKQSNMQDFVRIFSRMMDDHKNATRHYSLDDIGRVFYDSIVDNYAN